LTPGIACWNLLPGHQDAREYDMTASTRSTVVGVFADQRHAQKAAQELKDAGFREDQIGVVAQVKDASDAGTRKEEHGSHVVSGAVTGVAAGAGVGTLWCLGIVTLGLPAIGPVIAGGVFAAILASAAGTAAIAGIVGALIGLGIPEEEAKYYEGEFKSGRTLVTVKADNRYDEAWKILHRNGAYNKTTPALAMGATENQSFNVPVTREDVIVERRPAAGRGAK
jgi:hypothetical protein